MGRLVVGFIFLLFLLAAPAVAQQQTDNGRCARGNCDSSPLGTPAPGHIPQLDDWVTPPPPPGPDVPYPLVDLRGDYLFQYWWNDFECSAKWDEFCDDIASVPLPADQEYCVHYFHVDAWNHGSFSVASYPNKVDVRMIARGSGLFFDRYGGQIAGTLIVGTVPKGSWSPDRCLPRRAWAAYCHGQANSDCINDSSCADLPAVDLVRNPECLANETRRRTPPNLNTPPSMPLGDPFGG